MDAEFLEKKVSELKEKIKNLQEQGKLKIANYKRLQEEMPRDTQILLRYIIQLETYQELLK